MTKIVVLPVLRLQGWQVASNYIMDGRRLISHATYLWGRAINAMQRYVLRAQQVVEPTLIYVVWKLQMPRISGSLS
jgi:hypothetical protein